MASRFIFARSDTKNMAARLVSHSALDALREKNKLLFRWLLAHPSILVGSPDNLRSSFTNHLLFCCRARVYPRPSLPGDSPVYSQWRGLFLRNVTLGASTFGAFKNIMDEARLFNLLAGKFHLSIALNAKRFVGLDKWLDHGSPSDNEKAVSLATCGGSIACLNGKPNSKMRVQSLA